MGKSKIGNLKATTDRLGGDKWKRASQIVRDYGIRGLMGRVRDKMEHGPQDPSLVENAYVLVNDSPPPRKGVGAAPASVERVALTLTPNADHVAAIEVGMEGNAGGGELLIEIYDREHRILDHTVPVPEGRGMVFAPFAPQVTGEPRPLVFLLNGRNARILHDPKHVREGFSLGGGGRIYARVFSCVDPAYMSWMANNEPSEADLAAQRERVFENAPLFSVVVPLYNTPERYLRDMIQSLLAQTYGRWELCLADGSTDGADREAICASYGDGRIRYTRLGANEGIVGNTNHAIEMATGDYVCLLDHDDTLAPQALYANASLAEEDPDCEFIYSDEDKLTEGGSRRFLPFFKPDWSPEYLDGCNYITHFSVFKRTLLDEIGVLRQGYDGSQDYDLILRATERARKVGHIPEVLYHWRTAPNSTATSPAAKTYTEAAAVKALRDAVRRRGEPDAVVTVLDGQANAYHIRYPLPDELPKVSVVMGTNPDGSAPQLETLLSVSTYPDFEVVLVGGVPLDEDTDPRVRQIPWEDGLKPPAMLNAGAKAADGALLMFLDPNLRIFSPDWAEQLAGQALRGPIGAATGLLVHEDNSVREAGQVLYHEGVTCGSHYGYPHDHFGSFGRLSLACNVSAATAGCLMVRRDVFEEAGGFDTAYEGSLFDADLCQRLIQKGMRVVYVPEAQMYVAGPLLSDQCTPQQKDVAIQKWLGTHELVPDPCYSPHYTFEGPTFTVDMGPSAWNLEERLRMVKGIALREPPKKDE